jgi:hypothetical protein
VPKFVLAAKVPVGPDNGLAENGRHGLNRRVYGVPGLVRGAVDRVAQTACIESIGLAVE